MRTQRKKSPPKKARFPQKAPKNNYFKTMMETPEGRELRKNSGRRNAAKTPGDQKEHPTDTEKLKLNQSGNRQRRMPRG